MVGIQNKISVSVFSVDKTIKILLFYQFALAF